MDDGGSHDPSDALGLLGEYEDSNPNTSRDTPRTTSLPCVQAVSTLVLPLYIETDQFFSPRTPVVFRKHSRTKLHPYMRPALMDEKAGSRTWSEEPHPSDLSSFPTLSPYYATLESFAEESLGEIHVPPSSSPPELSSPASPESSSPLSDPNPTQDMLSHCSGFSISTSPPGDNSLVFSRPNPGAKSRLPILRDEFSNKLYTLLLQAKQSRNEIWDESNTSVVAQATPDTGVHAPKARFENLNILEAEFSSPTSVRSEESPMEIESDGPTFASPSPEQTSRIPKRRRATQDCDSVILSREHSSGSTDSINNPTPKTKIPAEYRIIRRAGSYTTQPQPLNGSPVRKKQKLCGPNTPPYTDKLVFRSASLRRAESLRSTDDDMIPTEPATPTYQTRSARPQALSVPIIAPPDQHIATLPLSPEALAKSRLLRLVERDIAGRERDGLPTNLQTSADLVTDPIDLGRITYNGEVSGEAMSGDVDDFDQDRWGDILGIGAALRSKVVEWMLKVLPIDPHFSRPKLQSSASPASPVSFSTSTSTTCSGSASFLSTSTNLTAECTSPLGISNLLDQLATSPETRFHAAYMFLRYFFLVMGDSPQSPTSRKNAASGTMTESEQANDGWELVIWDIAVGCISLSIKFHRDFLEPLLPVYSYEFQALAPHRPSHRDLENAQRDVLEAFSYHLGVTPQAFMDDLWLALSSLRLLLDFSGAWKTVRKQAWGVLFDSVLGPDVLQFPISLLTAAAVIEGIITTLVLKYESEAGWCGEVAQWGRYRTKAQDIPTYIADRKLELRNKRVRRAEREAEGVVQDIQAALNIKHVDLERCRGWLWL